MTALAVKNKPFKVGAGAWYPYSKLLERSFTLKDRFGELYELFARDFAYNALILPRGVAPHIDLDDVFGAIC